MPRSAPRWWWLLGSLLGACGGETVPASELIVIVDTDANLPCELDAISVQVIGPSGPLETVERPLSGEGAIELPLTLGLYQAGDADGPVEVIARGLLGGAPALEHRVVTRFLPQQRLALYMPLIRECAGAFCELDGLTCGETGCVSVDVSPDTLPPFEEDVGPSIHGTCMEEGLGGDGTCPGSMGDVVALPTMRDAVVRGALSSVSPTFARPVVPEVAASCPGDPSDTVSHYDTHVVCNAGAARSYQISLEGACAAVGATLADPFLVVYTGEAIPADPLMCLALSDDDAPSGCPDSRAVVMLGTNEIITVVATSYDGSAESGVGTYKLTFHPL